MLHPLRRRIAAAVGCLLLAACTDPGTQPSAPNPAEPTRTTTQRPSAVPLPEGNPTYDDVIPAPVKAKSNPGENYVVDQTTRITAPPQANAPAAYLADELARTTGVQSEQQETARPIALNIDPDAGLGAQGYRLRVTREEVTITGHDRAGVFNGVHTLLQLLPPKAEGPAVIAGGTITDRPRFSYRGTMLDVARHFFDADVVKRHIDRVARYKINYLHLHLTDDQGWRIQIRKWPKLTSVGGRTQVGGGRGGFYTQQEFREIVRYAASRGVTIVPEIDMPGHTNAALASYPELNCDGRARPPYTDTQVGFSTLCVSKPVTYKFVRDVIGEVAAMTPGPYLHVGGDEAQSTSDADYREFLKNVLPLVTAAGKRPVGWHEYAKATLPGKAVAQYWRIETADQTTAAAAARGRKVLMSPANKSYLDMKYFESDPRGNKWAGPVSVETAYDWDPARFLAGVHERNVLGVETPLWTELVLSEDDIERLAFPRIQAIAEVGWTPQRARDWDEFRRRLAAQGPRMAAEGIAYHKTPEINW